MTIHATSILRTVALSVLALGLTALTAGSIQERDLSQLFETMVRRFDLDLDGRISVSEFPRTQRAFRRFDRNRDGFLTRDEFAPRKDRPAERSVSPSDGADAAPASAEQLAFFESKIRPILADACYSCHSMTSARIRGELEVDSRAALLRGGETGPAIVPGDPDASPLIEAVRYADPIFAMPPKEPLSAEAVADLERWVAMGAPWPSGDPSGMAAMTVEDTAGGESLEREIDIEEGRAFWSFQPPARVAAPRAPGDDWSWSEIDRFLLASMQAVGVRPKGDADARTWLRRVTFDLTGLPPTPDELAAFESDRSAESHEKVVDRLLASPAFGERFGRHWLDVARYGESSGKESNVVYPHAWRYRDFVIDAINADMPYDLFLKKQIAGDLLPATDADERAENAIATGYLAIGAKSHNSRDRRQFALDVVDEQIDAMSQGMLGLTVSCARCHDHKFDPIPIEDYYALAGIFLSTETRYGTARGAGNNHPSELIELPDDAALPNGPTMDPGLRQIIERGKRRLERGPVMDGPPPFKDRISPSKDTMSPPVDSMSPEDDRVAARRKRQQDDQRALLDDLLARFDERGRANALNRLAMGVVEGTPRDIAVLQRGDLDRPGEVVARGVPQVLRGDGGAAITEGSGRLQLAEWIASEDNPLTARVWANRIWLHLFGAGIVKTPDNFGAGGQRPDHPELLDWLATELVAQDWSTKALVREIVLSHAYRLDSKSDARNAKVDPDVVTLWRMPDRRLEAEAIRDALLFVSGTLERDAPVGSPTGAMAGTIRREEFANYLTRERPVRSVYLASLRGHKVGALNVFDAPDATFVLGDREETNVATQALFMMNDVDVLRLSDAFADRLLAMDGSDKSRIRNAFELALGRQPSSSELAAVSRFLRSYAKLVPETSARDPREDRQRGRGRQRGRPDRGGGARAPEVEPLRYPRRAAWSAFAQSLFQSAEFRSLG